MLSKSFFLVNVSQTYIDSLKNKVDKIEEKLHFSILNYASDYTLHPKLWI